MIVAMESVTHSDVTIIVAVSGAAQSR